MSWEQPHWSGRQLESAAPRQKLRPNGFARLARFAAGNAVAVALMALAVALLCAGIAASRLTIDPDRSPRIALDETTARLQAQLDQAFPGVEQTFLAVVTGRSSEAAREEALTVAQTLAARQDVFLSAFVPGTGDFYAAHALLFHDLADVSARVGLALQMEPLFHALAAAPGIEGFTALVSEIGNAVEQGRSPPGLEAVLMAAAGAFEGEVKGRPQPVDWTALAGLDGEAAPRRWYVLATPVPGQERAAATVARAATEGQQGVAWLWPRRALQAAPSELRDFVVPASLSILLSFVLLFAGLGSFRQALTVMFAGAVTLSAAAAAAAALGRPLDGATWSFALAVAAPVIVASGAVAMAFSAARGRGLGPVQAAMLAAHRQGGFVSAVMLLFAALWAGWLLRQLPSLSHFAVIALAGCAVAWAVVLLVLPAMLALTARSGSEEGAHWLDETLGEFGGSRHGGLDIAAAVVLALAVFSAIFLPAMRFGERQLPSSPPPLLETPDARGAVHIVAGPDRVADLVSRLSALPEVGAIRTAEQFLPPDAGPKVAELRRLQALTPFEPVDSDGPGGNPADSLEELEQQLAAIANGPATSAELRDAAMRLRRAVLLFAAPEPPTPQRVAGLERALFGTLGSVSPLAQRLATLEPPGIAGLDPRLLRRFVSQDGLRRIEVMPREGTGELSFAAALRRAVPEAAGAPVVNLVRNEMIHHEALLALAAALVAVSLLVLAALRSLKALMLALAPTFAFLTLTAALTVLLDISLTAAMLAGISAAIAVLMCCAMMLARPFAGAGAPVSAAYMPLRAVLLPPLTLAAAAAPLVISSRPVVAELGAALAMLYLIVALLSVVLVPALARWLEAVLRPAARALPPG